MKEVQNIFSLLRKKGIIPSIDTSGKHLKLTGNVSNLSHEEKEAITHYKNEILSALSKSNGQVSSVIKKAPERSDYPLSPGQWRMWVLSQFKQGTTAYNMTGVFRLEGKLSPEKLEQAFIMLIEKYEILRTSFIKTDIEQVRQVITPLHKLSFALPIENLSDQNQSETHVLALAKIHSQTVFDLTEAPLLKAKLYKYKENKWIFAYVMHHIIADGWSIAIFMKELMAFYKALITETHTTFEPLDLQYKDYVHWLESEEVQKRWDTQKKYWLSKFKNPLPVLNLTGDYTRPPVKTFNGARVTAYLDQTLANNFQTLCNRQKTTLFSGLLTLVYILLYKYTAQKDIVIGTPVAGRTYKVLEEQIGLFINTLPLRATFGETDSFSQLLGTVTRNTLEAFEHQEYPFDTLLDAIELKRDPGRNPLFDVLVILQNNERYDLNSVGEELHITHLGEEVVTSKLDLQFDFTQKENRLEIALTYNTDIYSKETAIRFTEHLQNLIKGVLVEPEKPIRELHMLSEKEKQELLSCQGARVPLKAEKSTLIAMLERPLKTMPEAPAVLSGDRIMSYQELHQEANRLSHFLHSSLALAPEDRIAVKLPRDEWLLISLLAVLKAGCAYVPVDTTYPQERVAYIEKDSGCKFTIDEECLEKYRTVRDTLETTSPKHKITSSQLAYIIYTSGSTGLPKGVMIEHRNVVAFLDWAEEEFDHETFEVVYATTSHCFDLSVFEFFFPLSIGKKVRILDNALSIKDGLAQDTGVLINTVPSALTMLLDTHVSFSGVRVLNVAGEPFPPALTGRLPLSEIEVRNLYGPSEDTTYSTCFRIDKPCKNSVPIGRPIKNTSAYVLSEHMELLPKGAVGELYLSGEGISRGYFKRDALTDAVFVQNPFMPEELMYRTGDLVKWLPDGNLAFLGRKDNQVKIRGYRIEPGEIEQALISLESIEQAVITVSEFNHEKVLVAYISANGEINVSDIKAELGKKLPSYMQPAHFVKVKEFPLTSNGKIDRKNLPGVEEEDRLKSPYVAPRNHTEAQLAELWQNELGIEKVGVTDNFFHLGGHSLKATKILSLIHQEFDTKIDMDTLFESPTIEALALDIENSQWLKKSGETTKTKKVII
ncbi:amino acid adenylation domain-containing protein [Ascidiimonas aurantiaca]|uniref:non-ribosomal peptide synthetase n=1 Tax=Ascidiimonas aurantiaca TaxID=1685432 RepID=UPI0030ED89DE